MATGSAKLTSETPTFRRRRLFETRIVEHVKALSVTSSPQDTATIFGMLALDRHGSHFHNARVSDSEKHHLPRLNRHFYQGDAVVFWTNTIEQKSRGWLTAGFHSAFREIMLHAAAREQLLCPAYCLMPDHLHLVWMGFSRETDQLNAMAFVRKHLKPPLREGTDWQHQAHDHVLREEERKRNAFATFCSYTLANPVRAGLAESAERWPFSGAIVPGFPALNPFGQDYWETFWKIYVQKREKDPRLHGS